jgi:predicted metal-binding protein
MGKEINRIGRKTIISYLMEVACSEKIPLLCLLPYEGHPKGCPNYGCRPGCPPNVPLFDEIYEPQAYLAGIVFDFKGYLEMRRHEHPGWSEKALRNPRHWQGHLRAQRKRFVAEELKSLPGFEAIFNPEAMGVNVTVACRKAGIAIEWPPRNIVCSVALLARRKAQ